MPQGTTITLTPVAVPLSSTAGTHRPRTTCYDVLETMLSWLGGDTERGTHRDIKRGILAAYREFPSLFDWTYLITSGRILVHGTQTAGTIEFDATGGAYERLVTLTGATWPTWAQRGSLRIGDLLYPVDTRIDATRLTLSALANPGADLAALTTYALEQDGYPMPADFLQGDRAQTEHLWGGMTWVPPRELLEEARHDSGNTNTPCRYSFVGDSRGTGALILLIRPAPDRDQTLDFLYRRSMRPLQVWDSSTGTASISGTVVTLSGGALTAGMKGSIIRLGSGVIAPEGLDSPDAYALERTITEVLSTTTAQVDEAATSAAVGYRISDPIDLEDQAMLDAFVFGCRKHIALARAREDASDLAQQWQFQLALAKEADARDTSRRSASTDNQYGRMPLKYGRRGPDLE